ncbi:uncharacterized protein N7477_004224 [Penicillium maclennaniae]|uniref:uncharacterized protein n=1 Tax=Penicillium maclennaniae TaxID=1343394 RepID=UPI0025426483|nr:uncharacterized protein N7477_004224 [Penicillium maclennaniae]KAJ5674290.1 hypothetical protein N7477_004224 [Penicillium maclennaniae]
MSLNASETQDTAASVANSTPASTPQEAVADGRLNHSVPPDLIMTLARLRNELQQLQYELWLRTSGSLNVAPEKNTSCGWPSCQRKL